MLLKRLTEAMGPSGFEDEIRRVIFDEVQAYADRVYTDPLGSLIVEKKGTGPGPKVMLCAHMDEVSLMIVQIEENGLLKFRPIGGIDPRILLAKPVRIGKDKIFGVIGSKAIHLQTQSEREKPVSMDQMYIDIGAKTKEEAEKVVRPGDCAVFATEYKEIGSRCAKSKSFDDRVGCAVLIETLKKQFDIPLAFAFTVQEEIGLRGAGPVAYRVNPDMAVVVEGTICFDVVGAPGHGRGTVMGAGPALSVIDSTTIANREMLTHMIQVAEAEQVPYQLRRVSGGGNDAGRIHNVRGGVMTAVVSVPTRYIHAPSQIISLDDYENTIRLIEAFLRSVEKGGLQAQ
ncbi:M42 family metallopeptidase [Effusibacillus lacus]|uniref:Peptidase M42 n=1 Tax=Effusibacillus lacus TaxID=1348429 RepID=A0A292YMW6_9BACL|nr:M42 family metallopeptidase [Effusibacillus lacus]TCS75297.1 endoglucanase [Effusibacillus lacus]GAX89734.1 peptidase M42 [Effusibacillus lacus]